MTMMIDMTAQLAPMFWVAVAALAVSGAGIVAEVLPRLLRGRAARPSGSPISVGAGLASNPSAARC